MGHHKDLIVGIVGIHVVLGSALGEGVAGHGMVPSRYSITPWDFAAEIIDFFHSAQFEPSNFSSIGNTKFAGCDIVVSSFNSGQICFR